MRTHAPSLLAATLGHVRYRLALAIIGFGVFFGWLLACVIPLCIYESYSDAGGPIGETSRWAVTFVIFMIPAGLTYWSRRWIIEKALKDAPPEPVKLWTREDIFSAALAVVQLALGSVGLLVIAVLAAILGYGGYLLLTILSVPMAIVIGAIIIASAVLVTASR